jgi:hypothetical protein
VGTDLAAHLADYVSKIFAISSRIDNGDFNNFPAGFVLAGTNNSNSPGGDWWIVLTVLGDAASFQLAIRSTTAQEVYVRTRGSGSWRSWYKVN